MDTHRFPSPIPADPGQLTQILTEMEEIANRRRAPGVAFRRDQPRTETGPQSERTPGRSDHDPHTPINNYGEMNDTLGRWQDDMERRMMDLYQGYYDQKEKESSAEKDHMTSLIDSLLEHNTSAQEIQPEKTVMSPKPDETRVKSSLVGLGTRKDEPSRGKRLPTKLANYDGTTSWVDYESYYNEYAEAAEWDDEDKATYLRLSLSGVALSVFSGIVPSQRGNYQEVLTMMQQHFCPKEKVFIYQAELNSRKLGPDETLCDLSRDIQMKTRLAYPEAEGLTLNSLMTSCFISSLIDQDMRLSVATSHPRTLMEALSFATEYESIMAADRTQGETRKKVRAMKEVEEEPPEKPVEKDETETLKLLRELLAKQSTPSSRQSSRPPRRDKKDVCCYTCGEKGHYAFECKERAAASRKETPPPIKLESPEATKVAEN